MYNEEELIIRCKKGDPVAQEVLYKKYASRMRFVCLRYARTSFEVEDIFQDAFVKLFTHIRHYNGTGSFDGWVRRIFVNTAIDHYKKNNKWQEQPLDEGQYELAEVTISDEGFEQVANELSTQELLELANSLPEGYRIVFNLYVVEKYSHAQIAETLGIKEGTSKSQLSKARKMLKMLLLEYVAEHPTKVRLNWEEEEAPRFSNKPA